MVRIERDVPRVFYLLARAGAMVEIALALFPLLDRLLLGLITTAPHHDTTEITGAV